MGLGGTFPIGYDPISALPKAKPEHPFLSAWALRQVAFPSDKPINLWEGIRSMQCGFKATQLMAQTNLGSGVRFAIPQSVAELFANHIGASCGVRVPVVKASFNEPSNEDCRKNFVKLVAGDVWILSQRVPRSIPVYYLRDVSETLPPQAYEAGKQLAAGGESVFNAAFIAALDKRCPVDRSDYKEFPKSPNQSVLEAARWNSQQRIVQHCFRSLFGWTHAHTSNSLVDTDGRLWLIDHAAMLYAETTDDIAELHSLVKSSPVVMDACKRVGEVTQGQIEAALLSIDKQFWHRKSSVASLPEDAVAYLGNRLVQWRKFFCDPAPRGQRGVQRIRDTAQKEKSQPQSRGY